MLPPDEAVRSEAARRTVSAAAAYKRITLARLGRRFPAVLEALAQGEVHLGAVNALAACMTECNCGELLAAAKHKTTHNIELLVATRYPKDGLQCTHVVLWHVDLGPIGVGRRRERCV